MSDPLADFWVHTLTIRRYLRDSSRGKVYAADEQVTGFYQDRTDYSGGEIVATGRFAFPRTVAYVPPQSEVVLPAAFAARTLTVQSSDVADAAGLDMPAHQVIGVK